MKVKVTVSEESKLVMFDSLSRGEAFLNDKGKVCIKVAHDYHMKFGWLNSETLTLDYLRSSTMVEPIKIESIDIKIVRGSHSGTNR